MSKRGELLRMFSEKRITGNTRVKASEKLANMTDKQKEEKAGQMLTLLQESKTEQEFISKMEKF